MCVLDLCACSCLLIFLMVAWVGDICLVIPNCLWWIGSIELHMSVCVCPSISDDSRLVRIDNFNSVSHLKSKVYVRIGMS